MPGEFKGKRKTPADSITTQDVNTTGVSVVLNQHLYTSFIIKDGEESKSFKDLISEYMYPAMLAEARFVDKCVLGQSAQFLENNSGSLGKLTSANSRQAILNARLVMNKKKAYLEDRNMILTPSSEAIILNQDAFLAAYYVGDDGTSLREASLGRRLGFDFFMAQNMSSVQASNSNAPLTGAVNRVAGYSAGTTGALVTDLFTGVVQTGNWITIDGDNTPYRITGHTETAGNTTGITLHTALRYPLVDDAVINVHPSNTVNLIGGYPAKYAKDIIYSGTVVPQVGQYVTIGQASNLPIYSIIDFDTVASTITLDRPLDAAISNSDQINFAPVGEYNWAFHRNALALVVRPLAMPRQGSGALSAVVNWDDLSMRATITYQGKEQGHLVTLDMLFGVAVLDTNLGMVMFG